MHHHPILATIDLGAIALILGHFFGAVSPIIAGIAGILGMISFSIQIYDRIFHNKGR